MTVNELIVSLKKYDDEAKVYIDVGACYMDVASIRKEDDDSIIIDYVQGNGEDYE